jgi:tRNA 2-thiouridine synthesizing protein A
MEELDARGLLCPLPVLKARKRLLAMAVGAELVILADDPMAAVDLPLFCREAGHEFVGQEGERFVIRRGYRGLRLF